ncbi:orotidine-5'-phosphate decarboxylase [Pullulanibacillus sp. KACC 23026]|uniref:orotidine-5'-phosphate decarboxylase n=1 Tax=Pullulanibacillus sp. KACC 23026 TaxID=3028315 RepID=UPI0023B1D476|nr:orotidine-5'-phosphate decarboxylase [Pullulanibacillus sp. KACC 23026]WEG11637.1 orotidine-5'-phosphate decarboxylase [Pullulanibacillus sp. KACC 23026]
MKTTEPDQVISQKEVLVALDFPSYEKTKQFLKELGPYKPSVKVGMELFYQEGPRLIHDLKEAGYFVFLDLKLHDIPNTVKQAMKGLARLGVDMVNVHAAGGRPMMEAAREGLEAGAPAHTDKPLLIAVTQLTSTNQIILEKDLLIQEPLDKVIVTYARHAELSGLDGVVCSAWESKMIKTATRSDFLTVTPGIRLAGDDVQDQKRVATPSKARALESDYIVVGRSITKAANPAAAYETVCKEWSAEQ